MDKWIYEYKDLTREQKKLIDKVLLNEDDILWKYVSIKSLRNGNTQLNTKILGDVVQILLEIKDRGRYKVNENRVKEELEEQTILNILRSMYLDAKGK